MTRLRLTPTLISPRVSTSEYDRRLRRIAGILLDVARRDLGEADQAQGSLPAEDGRPH